MTFNDIDFHRVEIAIAELDLLSRAYLVVRGNRAKSD